MFQTFESRTVKGASAKRVAALRELLKQENLDGYIVPHADEHQSEYLPPSAERLAWLTGFTGSAGTAIVLTEEAAVFVDGRYTLQAAQEVDETLFALINSGETSPSKWLRQHASEGARIGYDPMLFPVGITRRLEARCREAGAALVPVDTNLIDALWTDRPEPPTAPIILQPLEHAGRSAIDKLTQIAGALGERNVDAVLLTQADSIAWAFNIRGKDVAHNPVPLTYALVRKDGTPTLYVDGRKLSNAIRDTLSDIADIADPKQLGADLDALARSNIRLLVDRETAASRYVQIVKGAGGEVEEASDPVAPLKARKNEIELAGARRAHIRDGVAMVRFLAWLDRKAPSGKLDEIACTKKLEAFRAEAAIEDGVELVDISFDTIAGAGPNGAIVHYRVNEETNRKLDQDSLFLIDSGGQYIDGTTDITRTVAIGTPTDEMRNRFSLVLKGHIAVADARFPAGVNGVALDAFARQALWNAGFDYDHGTGHGVGSFLSVHEGAARISKLGGIPLEAGMILSNEPGYYKTGEYGIRIENLVIVNEAKMIESGDRPMHSFETITLCPIDHRLIDAAILTEAERNWVNAYHARVYATLAAKLDDDDRAWLEQATQPI